MSVTEVAAKAKKAVEDSKKMDDDDLKEKKDEAKAAMKEAKEDLKEEKKMAKKEAQIMKKITGATKKQVVPPDAFGDSKPNVTKSRDPKIVSKELEEEEKLKKSIKKINQNLAESKKALDKHTAHVKELKELVKQQKDGSAAKTELDNVLNNAQKHVADLESHIKKGEKLVDDKSKKLDKLEKSVKATNQVDVAAAKVIKLDKKNKKEEN